MKKVVLFNPGVSSFNKGDEIISDAAVDHLRPFLEDKFVTNISTHTPLNLIYIKHIRNYDYKFVCGSNLLMGKMNGIFRQWDISLFSSIAANDAILVGVGWWQPNDSPNLYTKSLYRRILNKNLLHSVRDEYTKSMLKKIGITNVINTGCPTMWRFTPEFCKLLPQNKCDSVVFTLTDYMKDELRDRELINILKKNYENIYFWPQGEKDFDYLSELGCEKNINILRSTTAEYNSFLCNHDCDYIGTRLHGGIRALQYKKRSMIISIDNRAREKKKDFNIPCIERSDLDSLESLFINSSYSTDIRIPIESINRWKAQFNI